MGRRVKASAEVSQNGAPLPILALIYDFDGTLSPRPMQEYSFLPQIGEDPKAFWQEVGEVAKREEADGLITYMHLMYKKAKAKGVHIDRRQLVEQGKSVELFEGVAEWFDAIEKYIEVRAELKVEVRHYLVSSGLKEIIEGTPIYGRFHNVFASEYFFEAYDLPYPKRVITDTGKTQYLFRINKGIEDQSESINHHMPETDRPIPFANMIYFGDGDTDVPSMAVMRKNGGHAIAVHGADRSPATCIELYEAGRCDFYAVADYTRGSDLFMRTGLVVDSVLAQMRIAAERRKLSQSLQAGRS